MPWPQSGAHVGHSRLKRRVGPPVLCGIAVGLHVSTVLCHLSSGVPDLFGNLLSVTGPQGTPCSLSVQQISFHLEPGHWQVLATFLAVSWTPWHCGESLLGKTLHVKVNGAQGPPGLLGILRYRWYRPELLNLGTVDVLGQAVPSCGAVLGTGAWPAAPLPLPAETHAGCGPRPG